VKEGDEVAAGTGTGHLVDQLEAGFATLCEGGADIGDAVGNVVETRAALRQELADGTIGPGGGEQFDQLLATADQRRLGALVVHGGAERDGETERAGVEGEGLVECVGGDADVIYRGKQGGVSGVRMVGHRAILPLVMA
jgi:hypothetical protein